MFVASAKLSYRPDHRHVPFPSCSLDPLRSCSDRSRESIHSMAFCEPEVCSVRTEPQTPTSPTAGARRAQQPPGARRRTFRAPKSPGRVCMYWQCYFQKSQHPSPRLPALLRSPAAARHHVREARDVAAAARILTLVSGNLRAGGGALPRTRPCRARSRMSPTTTAKPGATWMKAQIGRASCRERV